MRKLTLLTLSLIVSPALLFAQEVLTLDDAFRTALSNNHQIKVLENQQEIADNSVNVGNAGLLPTVSAGASIGGNVNNTELEFAGGIPPTNVNGAQSSNTNANVTLNYVLFNGLSGLRTMGKLKLNKAAVDAQSRAGIEGTLLQVSNAYYLLVQATDQERIAMENVQISKQRYERAKLAQSLGVALRTELLSARVDLTSDSSTLLNASLQRRNSLRNLGRLLGTSLDETTTVEPVEITLQDWTLDQLQAAAIENNADVKNAELQADLAEKDLQLSWSSAFPNVSLSGGYSYNKNQSEAGIVLSNTAVGWNGNIGLNYTIFNGFRNNINRQNQKINLENASYQLEDRKFQLQVDLANAFANYEQSVQLLAFEESNLEASTLNLERTEELLKAGQITSTQFREAQLGLLSAQVRISNAKTAVKLNELTIMQLTGQILSN